MPTFAVIVTVVVTLACPPLAPFALYAILYLHLDRRRRAIVRARQARACAVAQERHDRAVDRALRSL